MKLPAAFSTAWVDFKYGLGTLTTFLAAHQADIVKVENDVALAATVADPSATPIINAASAFEEAIVGKILAVASDAKTAPTLQALFEEEWPSIQSLLGAVKNHPTVASVTAALAPKS